MRDVVDESVKSGEVTSDRRDEDYCDSLLQDQNIYKTIHGPDMPPVKRQRPVEL